MKKVSILLFGALIIATSGCRDKKAETQQAQLARLQAQQDSIRRADEQRILDLQIRAREDSLAMAIVNDFTSSPPQKHYSAYYIVTGSFLERGNANAYLSSMRDLFGRAQIIRQGRWSYVCVGGQYGSFSSARAALDDVKSQLINGGSSSDDEELEEEDEEIVDEEVEEDEELDEEEGDEGAFGEEGGGQAWVLGI
jgi:hypothetical protein